MREVREKRQRWRERAAKKRAEFLGRHMVPVIFGPKERHYIIDHHHLCRAMYDEGVKKVFVTVVSDLRHLDAEAFWVVLDHRGWTHPYDEDGKRRGFTSIPTKVSGLMDDPFRSLAGELRRIGGFAKDTTPFSEFLWADFLRRRMNRKSVERDFEASLERAPQHAKGQDAHYLPGWCGPAPEHEVSK